MTGPNEPMVRLLRIGVPADRPAAAARASMAARMAPEVEVVDIDTETSFAEVTAQLEGERPWGLLALPGATVAGADLARRLTLQGRPPAQFLVRAEGEPGVVRTELRTAAKSGPLECPVCLLVTVEPGRHHEVGGWEGLGRSAPTVRLLAPDEPLDSIARVVKEELQVWPA